MKKSATSSIFKSHVRELRNRLGYVLFSLICALFIAYYKSIQLMHVFLLSFSLNEHQEKNFIFTDVYEAFSSTISICFISSLLCTLPLLVYQSICFTLPSRYTHEREKLCKRVTILFLSWASYIFLIHSFMIPKLCSFLLQFQIKSDCLNILIEPKIFSYISWAISLLGIATIAFLLISGIYLCFLYGIFHVDDWRKHRKMSILIFLLFASFVSPPEVWSQFLLALILFLFCEFLVWSCFVHNSLQKIFFL